MTEAPRVATEAARVATEAARVGAEAAHVATGPHTDALATLRDWAAPTGAQESLRATYVAHLESHPDGVLKQCAPDHLTASALVLSADRACVLLTLHRKAQRWFQLGGHIEAGDTTLAGAALREAREESGIADLRIDSAPVQLDTHLVHFCHPGQTSYHLDVRYVLTAPPGAEPAVSAESSDLRWWPVGSLPTDEPGILDLVAVALSR